MRRAVVIGLVLSFFAASGGRAAALQSYIEQLDAMRVALHEGRVADAQAQAKALKGTPVDTPNGKIAADGALLNDVIANRVGTETRLALAIHELRSTAPRPAAANDRKLLERLRHDETPAELKKGGEVAQPPISEQPLLERMVDLIGKGLKWIGDKLEKFWEWLGELWPKQKMIDGKPSGGVFSTRWTVGAVVVAILAVLGILAFEVMRRSKRNVKAVVTESELIASARDEDPTSRGATEWERYAAQLAAAGRVREAIRAWYHAVLVTCYGAGILHYRKGRTNWEYVGALSPELPWRSDFVALTRRFEHEWYGRTESTGEALDDCAGRAERILDGLRRGIAA